MTQVHIGQIFLACRKILSRMYSKVKGAKVLDYWIWSTLQASTHKDCEKTFNKVHEPPQATQWNPPNITWLNGKENISAMLFHQLSLIQNSWAMSLASCWEIGWNRGKLQSMKLITVRKQKDFQNCSLSSAFSRKIPLFTGEQLLHTSLWYKTQLLSKCNLAEESSEAPTSLHILRQSNHLCFTRRLLSWFWHSQKSCTGQYRQHVKGQGGFSVWMVVRLISWNRTLNSKVLQMLRGEECQVNNSLQICHYLVSSGLIKRYWHTKRKVETNVCLSRLHNSITAAERFFSARKSRPNGRYVIKGADVKTRWFSSSFTWMCKSYSMKK